MIAKGRFFIARHSSLASQAPLVGVSLAMLPTTGGYIVVTVTGSATTHYGDIIYVSEVLTMGEAVELFRLIALVYKSVNLTIFSESE